eukprot:TRINITY_DN5554_c0_g2_i1.p1 TRINITY_DN5554_c0_g2~~TRINITY_DN5554_c0_g2_i1.p1  ORF type:complete len:122 (+),score=27.52 TRINITY_DN5554_c0_g2_i1:80-445(+)
MCIRDRRYTPPKEINASNKESVEQSKKANERAVDKLVDQTKTGSSSTRHRPPGKETADEGTSRESLERKFLCGCGRNYQNYPSLYAHIKAKHGGVLPVGTIAPRTPNGRRGRPRKVWQVCR